MSLPVTTTNGRAPKDKDVLIDPLREARSTTERSRITMVLEVPLLESTGDCGPLACYAKSESEHRDNIKPPVGDQDLVQGIP